MKLLNINVGIKINNTKEIAEFIKSQDADFVAAQEVVRHLSESVYDDYRSKKGIEEVVKDIYPSSFFGPLWVSDGFYKSGEVHRDFGGMIEQGNWTLSKYPFIGGINEHYYKTYSLALDWTNWKDEDHGRAVLISEINVNGKRLQVLNLHGIWTEHKQGDERTIKQCQYILEAAKRQNIATIITGDFNLLPGTKSMQIIEKEYRSLIDEYGIKSTRPTFDDGIDKGDMVVDYIFVSEHIKVNDFKVINTNISDHLPLLLDFEII